MGQNLHHFAVLSLRGKVIDVGYKFNHLGIMC